MTIWPSLIYLALVFFGNGTRLAKGEFTFIDLIAQIGVLALLYWGGFFDALLRSAA